LAGLSLVDSRAPAPVRRMATAPLRAHYGQQSVSGRAQSPPFVAGINPPSGRPFDDP
jgi:hypothetical protein